MLERCGSLGYVCDRDFAKRRWRSEPEETLLRPSGCPHDACSVRDRETPLQDEAQANEVDAHRLNRLGRRAPRVLDCIAVNGEAVQNAKRWIAVLA